MKIDLCELFGVKPDQIFGVKGLAYTGKEKYRVHDNVLQCHLTYESTTWDTSYMEINELLSLEILEIVRYPATDVEKTILGSVEEEYKNGWVARDKHNDARIYIYRFKPIKKDGWFIKNGGCYSLFPYSHLFQFIQFDTGAVRIKDIIGE